MFNNLSTVLFFFLCSFFFFEEFAGTCEALFSHIPLPPHTHFQVYTHNYTNVFIKRGKKRSMQNKVQILFAVCYNPELLIADLQLRENELATRERCFFPAFFLNIIIQHYKQRCFWNRLLGVENKSVVLEKIIEKNPFFLLLIAF